MINNIMPKNYLFLLSIFHYLEKEEEENCSDGHTDDSCHKIKFFLEKLSKNFQKHYSLGKNITIDESLLHFTGKNHVKFYIPMKPHKCCLKFIYYMILIIFHN